MRRSVFIIGLSLVMVWGSADRAVAQEKDSTEEQLRSALEALGALQGLEGLKALERIGRVEALYGLEGLKGLEALKVLGGLDLSSLDVADEYLDILEQCRGMLEDYEAYLDQLDAASRKSHEVSVEKLRRRLDDNTYIDDPDKLIADLTEAVNSIKEIERAHKAEVNSNNPRCCRVIRNLRREMVILVDLIEDYNDQNVETVLDRDEIKKYMAEALTAYVEALKENEEARQQQQREERVPFVVIPAPRVPAPPTPPQVVFPEWTRQSPGSREEVGLVKKSEGILQVTSARPVKIINSAGGIQVTGWNEDFVSATLGIEVSADTRAKEKQFAQNTQLLMNSNGQAYLVEARFPELSDPETKIIRCVLLVSVPDNLHIETDNSFGEVLAGDLRDGIVVTTRHSGVTLDNISGPVKVTNTMGAIALSDIRGEVTAKTSYAPITLVGCDGMIGIENAYAEVTLSDTRGPATIRNSGQITVRDHQGKLTITNTYGLVQAFDIGGDVSASNAYQPIEVSSINGSVKLDNQFSQIKISEVTGSVTAGNSHGLIHVEDLEGPVFLSNKSGTVTLVLEGPFRGGSSVTASHSTVNLVIRDELDLKILASVTDGQITSPLTYRVDTRGNTTDAEWILGDGGEILKVVGNNSNLVVSSHQNHP